MDFFNLFFAPSGITPIPYTSTLLNQPEHPFAQNITFLTGSTLTTINTSLNEVCNNVDSLSNTINSNTTAVNTAGQALKDLTSTGLSLENDAPSVATVDAAGADVVPSPPHDDDKEWEKTTEDVVEDLPLVEGEKDAENT
ncbi:hypothetical protein L6452_22383 [Arctium lappa]|uniref:Uncharacterized protein n=1 Tax=Arctium lappa TaxID=4217 RepID=A0ACB9AZM6_ARCLA|nr:hypothetical protein L6452_22383 [Arctium lappa]